MKKRNIIIILGIIIVMLISGYFVINKIQKNKKEYEIETISEYKYFVVKEKDKYGVIDTKGNKIIETLYEDVKIPNPEKAIFVCYENETTKILNEKSEEIFTQYENIEPLRLKNISSDLIYEKNILTYCKDKKYGIINLEGKRITKPIYEEIDTLQYKEGELIVKRNGKYGIINIKGATLVEENYDKIEADKFYEEGIGYKNSGYIVSITTEEGYRYGYVNLEGKEIVGCKYNDLQRVTQIANEIYIICAENGKYGLLKNSNKIIENEYQSLVYTETINGFTALKGKKYGVISIDGNIKVPFEYKQIDITGEYIYATMLDENIKIFNSKGEETNISENLAIVNVKDTDYKIYIENIDGKTTYNIYKKEQKVTEKEYTYIQYLFDKYFIACDINGSLGIIDENENERLAFNYNSIQKIENTTMVQTLNNETKMTEIYSKEMKKISELPNATIENNKEYIKLYNEEEIKYISKDEKQVENTEIFKNNKLFAKKEGDKWGFVDSSGNSIIDCEYENVTEINKYGYAGIKQNNLWGIIDGNGKIVVKPRYELNSNNPIFIGEYYEVIYGNGEIYYTK